MAAVPFGFSIGDFIAGINLIITSINAVKDATNSEYQNINAELEGLKTALSAIENLHLQQNAYKHNTAIEEAKARLRDCVKIFVSRIAKYQPWLQPNKKGWTASLRKIQFELCTKEDLLHFRSQLERHSSSINMLLITLQISQSLEIKQGQEEHKDVIQATSFTATAIQQDVTLTKDLMTGLSKQQMDSIRFLMTGHQQLLSEVGSLRQMLQLEREVPPQIPLQKPVILHDACGRVAPFHLDFINSAEAFFAVLKVRFKQYGVSPQGLQKVDRSEFLLRDRQRILSLEMPWERLFKPGQTVDMSMAFRHEAYQEACPSCGTKNDTMDLTRVDCTICGLQYSVDLDISLLITSIGNIVVGDGKKAKGSMARTSTPAIDSTDTVMDFRRVHIMAPATQSWFDDLNNGAMEYEVATKAVKSQPTQGKSSLRSAASADTPRPLPSLKDWHGVARGTMTDVWFCCQCRNLNLSALAPGRCSICGHHRDARCTTGPAELP